MNRVLKETWTGGCDIVQGLDDQDTNSRKRNTKANDMRRPYKQRERRKAKGKGEGERYALNAEF